MAEHLPGPMCGPRRCQVRQPMRGPIRRMMCCLVCVLVCCMLTCVLVALVIVLVRWPLPGLSSILLPAVICLAVTPNREYQAALAMRLTDEQRTAHEDGPGHLALPSGFCDFAPGRLLGGTGAVRGCRRILAFNC